MRIRWASRTQRVDCSGCDSCPLTASCPARATVQLYNSEGPFARTFAGLQIHLVSWLHYVY
jgi:hypothetical protein